MLENGALFAGQFHIVKHIASGGTADIYQAVDQESSAIVCLKVFDRPRIDSDVLSEIWAREVEALNRLSHPSIVRINDASRDSESGLRFSSLEWINGATLEKYLNAKGCLSWSDFYREIGQQLLEVLCYAFEKNVRHRDLSIDNVLVAHDDTIKVIDFGQAKLNENIVGRTVGGWKTPPYCPPEDGSGRYSNSRDPYSYCAIAVRALTGSSIKSYDDLYRQLDTLEAPDKERNALLKGLERNPEKRHENILALQSALAHQKHAPETDKEWVFSVRLAPDLDADLRGSLDEDDPEPVDLLAAELSDTCAILTGEHVSDLDRGRFKVETTNFRLVLAVDDAAADNFVIIYAVRKRFELDRLYAQQSWMVDASFTSRMPRASHEKMVARQSIAEILVELERRIEQGRTSSLGERIFDGWRRLIEALRYIERTREEPLRYTDLNKEGTRVTFTVENPEDAQEGQERVIWDSGRPVFFGTVEGTSGDACTIHSKRRRLDPTRLPPRGALEIDWRQARVSLARQEDALEKFAAGKLPNQTLRSYVSGKAAGDGDELFQTVDSFYTKDLDSDKKAIVSRFLATPDFLLVHGPPGTGKTTLIVEMIRQQLKEHKGAKVLLVSQTHVAIDNVLEKLDAVDPELKPVRIGSGTRAIGTKVAHCSVEARGRALQKDVETATESYLKRLATDRGISFEDVLLGLRVSEVVALLRNRDAVKEQGDELEREKADIERSLSTQSQTITREVSELTDRVAVLERKIDDLVVSHREVESRLVVARDRLRSMSATGRQLAGEEESSLIEWSELLDDPSRSSVRELLQIAEEWKLKFGQSKDFEVAIVATARVVAGTCIGFCKESAATSVEYDVCIIDEASKATTAELLVPMSYAKKVVLVGDHHQLPAVIEYALTQADVQEKFSLSPEYLEKQLFEALQETLPRKHRAELVKQYRMHPAIGDLVSQCFYDGRIENGDRGASHDLAQLALTNIETPLTWVDTDPNNDGIAPEHPRRTSFVNPREVACIVQLLKRVAFVARSKGSWPDKYSIAVLSGYASQANLLRREIEKEQELDCLQIVCDTVHAFQGREVDLCIYSVTRNNQRREFGFLEDWRHLNVALSRAKDYLVIVGGLHFCSQDAPQNPFTTVTRFMRQDGRAQILDWEHG